MPHPIPAKPYPAEFDYYLVALPSGVGFRRVAHAIFTELSYPWLWGLEGLEDDSEDAAQRWTDAVNETWRLLEMGWPDEMLSAVDEVEELLRGIRGSGVGVCCETLPGSDALVGQPGTKDTSTTDVGGSTFPDGLTGEQFDDYLCDAANAYVDSLIDLPNTILTYFQGTLGSLTILILYYFGVAYLTIAGLAVFTLAELLGLVESLQALIDAVNVGSEDTQSTVSGELLAVRNDLVCAIYSANDHEEAGTQLRQTISDAVSSTAWTNVLLLLNPDSALAKVFNHELKPAVTGLTCDCAPPLSAGYNLIDLSHVSVTETNGTVTTLTDNGDSTFFVEGVGTSGNYDLRWDWELQRERDLSGWTVEHIGYRIEVTAKNHADNQIGPYAQQQDVNVGQSASWSANTSNGAGYRAEATDDFEITLNTNPPSASPPWHLKYGLTGNISRNVTMLVQEIVLLS